MKTIKITLLLMLLSCISYGQLAHDKKLHIIAGAGVSAVTYAITLEITRDTKNAFWYSFGSAVLAGLIKEIIDESKYGGFDSRDLLASSIGGLTVSTTLNLFHKQQKKMIY